MSNEIPITEALEEELASTDDGENLWIGIKPGTQSTHGSAFPVLGATDRSDRLLDRGFTVQRGQSFEIAVIDALADLGPTLTVGDPFALLLVQMLFSCANSAAIRTQVIKTQTLGSHTEPQSHEGEQPLLARSSLWSSCLRVRQFFGCGRRPPRIATCQNLVFLRKFSRSGSINPFDQRH